MAQSAPAALALDISCTTCGAQIVVPAGLRTAECPYCASPHVVTRPAGEGRIDPTFVLGFTQDQESAAGLVRQWLNSRGPFVHSGLKQGVVEGTQGIYLPSYLYGARAQANYSARIGEDYTVVVTYTTTDAKGNTTTHTRTETRTEWRSLTGEYESYVMDVVVTASKGIANSELQGIEPFDLRALQRFTPDLLAGWTAEEPSLGSEECIRLAQTEAVEGVESALQAFMPGDSSTGLKAQVELSDEVADLCLMPVWVYAVRFADDKAPIRILVNGQTGKIAGKVPYSPSKIILAVLLVLGAIGGILALGGAFS